MCNYEHLVYTRCGHRATGAPIFTFCSNTASAEANSIVDGAWSFHAVQLISSILSLLSSSISDSDCSRTYSSRFIHACCPACMLKYVPPVPLGHGCYPPIVVCPTPGSAGKSPERDYERASAGSSSTGPSAAGSSTLVGDSCDDTTRSEDGCAEHFFDAEDFTNPSPCGTKNSAGSSAPTQSASGTSPLYVLPPSPPPVEFVACKVTLQHPQPKRPLQTCIQKLEEATQRPLPFPLTRKRFLVVKNRRYRFSM